ncbi:MAG: protein translocase subunit SecD [Rhodothermales bacterium]
MQDNGFKVFVTLAFLGLSLWYLFPTLQSYFMEQRIEELSDTERVDYVNDNYTEIRDVRERALKLGLDLQGGMHVTLEVRMDALVRALATDVDAAFEQALAASREEANATGNDFVEIFVDTFEEQDPNVRLSRYFRNTGANITRRSDNPEVASYLRAEADEAVTRAISIVRERVDRFGVSEPSIQQQGSRRIVVELPGVDDPQRVRDLLRGTARLEFRLMADPGELNAARNRIIAYFDNAPGDAVEAPVAVVDPVAADTSTVVADTAAALEADDLAEDAAADTAANLDDLLGLDEGVAESENPLLRVLSPIPGESVIFGAVAEQDTAAAGALLRRPAVQQMLPPGVKLLYTAKAEATTETGADIYYLLGVRGGDPELTGEVITEARPDFDPYTNEPEISITMNSDGAQTWSRLTGANVGRPVSIVLDDLVYSYPTIIDKIPGGRTSITGVTRTEAEDVVVVLKSGALPAPVDIVEERTVGPSLGAASIRAGTVSVLVGLLLVAFFMVFFYRTAGLVANLALLLNILFIFGILAAFGATLTLPGIAGIVLTIGMAVDANVLIFERIREEMTSGKTLKASIDGGYAKALSAIADANITTFFVGVILYSFGVGPIQGFAVTLMAGILSSLFTAIVVTRIVFDYFVAERRSVVAFG